MNDETTSQLLKENLLTDQVYQVLRRDILDGKLVPGSGVVDSTIARRLGVSRTPVRDAIRRLMQEGLLEQVSRRKIAVAGFLPTLAVQTYLVRIPLEAMAVELVCWSPEREILVGRLRQWLDASEAARAKNDATAVARANHELHNVIVQASNNPVLLATLDPILARDQLFRTQSLRMGLHAEIASREHYRLTELIAEGNGHKAKQFMEIHIAEAGLRLAEMLVERSPVLAKDWAFRAATELLRDYTPRRSTSQSSSP